MNICRILENKIAYAPRSLSQFRAFSAEPAVKKLEKSFQEEWGSAKKWEDVPEMSRFESLKRFLPGGKFHNMSIIKMHEALKSEFGSCVRFRGMLGRPTMMMIYNPEDFEKVFRSEGQYPQRRTIETLHYYRKKMRPDIYEQYGGLLNEQGENWHRIRTTVNPIMLKPQTVKLYVPQVDEIAQDFVKMIENIRDSNDEVPANFSDYVNQWGLESIACITLNRRLGLLNENYHDENAEKLIKLIRKFFIQSADFEVNPSIWRYYHTKAFKELLAVYDGMTELIMKFVNDAIEKLEPSTDEKEESLLEKFTKIDKKIAVVMCADALLAGVDTTSSGFLGVLYCLAKNPDKQEILREELIKILPNKSDSLTIENMRNLPYLRAVIKEGFRLYTPTVGNLRTTSQDLVLAGYQVPKGTEVVMGIMTASHDEKNFAKAKEYIPERWLKSNTDPQCPHAKDANPFAFLPFGFGARMCVGRRFAELELETLLIRIIRNFKVEWNYPEMKIKSVLVNIPEGDLKFKFTKF